LLKNISLALDLSNALIWLAPPVSRPETYQYLELALSLSRRASPAPRPLIVVSLSKDRIASIPRYLHDFARIDGQGLDTTRLAMRIVAELPKEE
jgi:hypothetical protein